MLSDFCNVVSKSIIINSKSASNITSELESLSTLRFGQISELSDADSLNHTRVKEFTGDGVINYRGLFQKEKTIEVTASIHIATNNIPHIDCSDPAMLTRIIPFPFKSVFEPDSDYADLVMEEKIINSDSFVSFVHEHLKKSHGTRVQVAEFIECYKAHLAALEEICFLSNKKIMELLRKLGFELFRSDNVQYIINSILIT